MNFFKVENYRKHNKTQKNKVSLLIICYILLTFFSLVVGYKFFGKLFK